MSASSRASRASLSRSASFVVRSARSACRRASASVWRAECAGRAVHARAGEHHGDGLPAAVGRQALEERVDGIDSRPALAAFEGPRAEGAALDRDHDVGAGQVDRTGLRTHAIDRFPHRHGGPLRDEACQAAPIPTIGKSTTA
jgi:hypothetical protein